MAAALPGGSDNFSDGPRIIWEDGSRWPASRHRGSLRYTHLRSWDRIHPAIEDRWITTASRQLGQVTQHRKVLWLYEVTRFRADKVIRSTPPVRLNPEAPDYRR